MRTTEPFSRHLDLFVLVVDDGLNMRRLVRDMLFQIGLTRVRCEAGSEDLLEQFRQIAPDLLIMSWDLTRIPPESLARLAARPTGTGPIPVIALLDQATRAGVLRARSAGAHSILQKPIAPGMLRDRIKWVMNRFVTDPNGSATVPAQPLPRGLARDRGA
jgi:two-component system chemotaxis response regulator CheY